MIQEKIDILLEKINIDDIISYREDDHYYIMSVNKVDNVILIQEKDGIIIVWSYKIDEISSGLLIRMIDQVFDEAIIFPYIETDEHIALLKKIGYTQIEFDDLDTDKEMKKYPSFRREEKIDNIEKETYI